MIGNAPGEQVEPGAWEFERTQPLSTYFVTVVAGPYHLIRDEHDGIPLGLSARQSIAAALDADADELFTMTKQCFDEFHRLFGIRYPFGDYHQAFVPEFNAGAMENPGCVTFRDPLVFSSRVTRGVRIQRATTVAHEMAHQWFGNIVTPKWWDDLWLNESFAEYMGNRVTADVTEYADAWIAQRLRAAPVGADGRPGAEHPPGRRQRRRRRDRRAPGLRRHLLRQGLEHPQAAQRQRSATRCSSAGAIDHFTRHRFGNATMHDLFAQLGATPAPATCPTFTSNWLRTAGPDTIVLDRGAGVLRRTPPADHPADRPHTFRIATAAPGAHLDDAVGDRGRRRRPTSTCRPARPCVLDPYEDTWALVQPDPVTVATLKDAAARPPTTRMLRAGIWNNVRSAFHNAAIDPADVLDLLEAGMPVEDSDDAVSYTMPWAIQTVAPLSADHGAVAARACTRVARAMLDGGRSPGSTLQLAAFQAASSSATDSGLLRAWLAGRDLPDGIELDLDLRWRVLVRLAIARRGRPARARRRAGRRADRPVAASSTRGRWRRCPTRRPRPGPGSGSPARSTCPTTSSRPPASACGGSARSSSPSRTSTATSTSCPAPSTVRQGWVLADAAPSRSSRSPR